MAMLSPLVQDLRYGIRSLVRSPGFTAVAVAVLSLGIGVNATVFSLANAFFLRPLPVSDPERVVRVYANRFSNVSRPLYEQLRDRNSTLEMLAGFQGRAFALTLDAEPEHAFGEVVTGNYFPALGIAAARGRLLGASDDTASAQPVVVLSHAFWVRRFGAAENVVGSTISLNGVPFVVAGIVPRGFTGVLAPLAGDLWVPIAADSVLRPALDAQAPFAQSLHLVGRLKTGVERAQAQADLDTIGHQVRSAAGEPPIQRAAVTVYGPTMLHPETSTPVTAFTAVLMTVVALVLLIVCVNIANLVLARSADRRVELAVRQSLGAGRSRLIRQLLTENLLLAIAGSAAGVAIAVWATRLAMAVRLPVPIPVHLDLSVDVRVLAFTALVAAVATLAFGLAPALTASRVDLVSALKGQSGGAGGHGRMRSAFLIAQVSMSILLLVTAGLFIRSFHAAQAMERGFDAADVTTASIDLETRGYSQARGVDFTRSIVERIEAKTGVTAANVVDIVPLTLSNATIYLLRDGDAPPQRGQGPPTPKSYVNAVGPGHFETLRIPLLGGRDFTHHDTAGSARVAIVNETFARKFWPGKDAIGERLRPMEENAAPLTVIGVVRDSKYVTVGEAERPFLYRPLAQAYTPRLTLLVRAAGTPASVISMMKQEVRALDPGLALFNAGPMSDATAISLLPARVAGNLLGGLGLFALLLAALGIYGVLSFLVRARTREIGIRVAVGATPREVATLVVRQAVTWTAIGAAIGLGLALALTRLLESFLYGINATDPWTFGGVTLLLALVALGSALAPALRASRLEPTVALRAL